MNVTAYNKTQLKMTYISGIESYTSVKGPDISAKEPFCSVKEPCKVKFLCKDKRL